MKRLINTVLIVIISIASFSNSVYANEINNEKIGNISLIQDNKEIQKDGDIYTINNYNDMIYLKYNINNINEEHNYSIQIYNSDNYECGYNYNINSFGNIRLILKNNSEIEVYTVKLYRNRVDGTSTYYDLIDTKTIKIKVNDYTLLKDNDNTKLYVTKIIQNNKELSPTIDELNATFNTIQFGSIIYSLKGKNFHEELQYKITNGDYFNKVYTGKEINDGIDIEMVYYNEFHSFDLPFISIDTIDYRLNPIYDHNGKDLSVYLNNTDPTSHNYDLSLSYNDGSSIRYNIVQSKIYEQTKTLKLNIKGYDLEDRNYEVLICINDKNSVLLYDKLTINGKLLNEGYTYTINNLELASDVFKAIYDNNYYINVSIDNEIRQLGFDYHLAGNISVSAYYNDNVTELPGVPRGPLQYSNVMLSKCYIENTKEIILKYSGTDYENNKEYTYILSGGIGNYNDVYHNIIIDESVIYEGTIKGSILNTEGLIKKVIYDEDDSLYKLIVKDGNEVVNFVLIKISLSNIPYIELKIKKPFSQSAYFTKSNEYTFPYEMNKQLEIKGICDIDKTANYTFNVIESLKEKTICYLSDCKHEDISNEISITGNELINGYLYNLKENNDLDIKYHAVGIHSFDYNVYFFNSFNINYKNIDDYLNVNKDYTFDKKRMKISDISDDISINDFLNNISLKNGINAKIYYQDKEVNNNDIVKNGMILKINSEEEQFEIKLNVNSSLKGDLNGNGKVDLQDIIILLKKYLKTLETTDNDIIIGDMDNSGSINLKDIILLLRAYLNTN